MTPSNSTIQTALNGILVAANLGYAISWPGPYGQDAAGNTVSPFEPPTDAPWLEVTFLPNRGYDDGVNGNSSVIPQGIYQVAAVSRPQSLVKLTEVAEEVQAAFQKGATVTDSITVNRAPYQGTALLQNDRMSIAVTIEYSG